MLGHYGKGKWMGDQIGKAAYRSHRGGVWSMISSDKKLPVRLNTYYWLYRYYSRIGKKVIGWKWYGKIIYTVIMSKLRVSSARTGHYTDGSRSR